MLPETDVWPHQTVKALSKVGSACISHKEWVSLPQPTRAVLLEKADEIIHDPHHLGQ